MEFCSIVLVVATESVVWRYSCRLDFSNARRLVFPEFTQNLSQRRMRKEKLVPNSNTNERENWLSSIFCERCRYAGFCISISIITINIKLPLKIWSRKWLRFPIIIVISSPLSLCKHNSPYWTPGIFHSHLENPIFHPMRNEQWTMSMNYIFILLQPWLLD